MLIIEMENEQMQKSHQLGITKIMGGIFTRIIHQKLIGYEGKNEINTQHRFRQRCFRW